MEEATWQEMWAVFRSSGWALAKWLRAIKDTCTSVVDCKELHLASNWMRLEVDFSLDPPDKRPIPPKPRFLPWDTLSRESHQGVSELSIYRSCKIRTLCCSNSYIYDSFVMLHSHLKAWKRKIHFQDYSGCCPNSFPRDCMTEDFSFEPAVSWRLPSVPFGQAFIPQYGCCFYHASKDSLLFPSAKRVLYNII